MYPGHYAVSRPNHPAMIMAGSGDTIGYAELDRRSIQLARLLDQHGIADDATVAVVCENRLEWAEILWGVIRSGRSAAPVNTHLGTAELREVLQACEASALLAGEIAQPALDEIVEPLSWLRHVFILGGDGRTASQPGRRFVDYHKSLAATPVSSLDRERLGGRVMFSSGTTGTPKAIRHNGGDMHPADAPLHLGRYTDLFEMDGDTVYLSPAPTYHTAPYRFVHAVTQLGGTVVSMERFAPEAALRAIQDYRVTHAQFVPTMLLRMLRLPAEVRRQYDLSSLRVVITGGAPCPHQLKLDIMDWWGPVLHELYGASESYGNCHIGPHEIVEHPGSVGRALRGTIHVTDEAGDELGPTEPGVIWFEGTAPFSYHGDESKTQRTRHPLGWQTVGDLGYVDRDGYLYITGRRDHMIISGGVNIQPQESEGTLQVHPKVADVAVVGVPDEEYGQSVKAVVVAAPGVAQGDELADELIDYCRERLAHFKCPRSVVFVDTLPRGENGKLYKNELKAALP